MIADFLIGMALFLGLLAALGLLADGLDARRARRDAYRRNHARRVR